MRLKLADLSFCDSLSAVDSLIKLRLLLTETLAIALVALTLCLPQALLAQTPNEQEVTGLLAEIESKNRVRPVFGANSLRKIGEVAYDSKFKVVKRMGRWNIVEFYQQTVPGWVSTDYVNISRGRATVQVSNLNMRYEPSLNSNVMLQLSQGFSSTVVGRSKGFVRILAPSSYRVAVLTGNDSQAQEDLSIITSTNAEDAKPSNISGARATNSAPDTPIGTPAATVDNASTSSERLHVIAPGDAISLLVFGESDLSIQNVRVPQSGRVSLPLIGSVFVAGETIPQVEETIAKLLAQGYVKNPKLSVTMFSYRPVFIRGAIQQTGSFPFSEGLTVGTAIALAGGSKKSAKANGVSILREGNVVETALSVDSQIEVQSGDVISIEEEVGVQEDDATYIYLHGEVASPGEYQFRRGLTVEKAIVLAGGFTLRASRKKISVTRTRYADVEANQEPEKIKKVKLFTPIKPGDVINIGASWF